MTGRRLAIATLLAALAAAATPGAASAGEYPVYACEPAFGDVNHSWFAESNTPKMTAYTACPVPWSETRTWNQGLVTRPSVTSGYSDHVGYLSYALLRLRAPAGASLSRMTYQHTFCAGAQWEAGLLNDSNQWLHASSPGTCGTFLSSPYTLALNGTRSVALATICATSSCELGGSLYSWASMRSATVWIADSTRPSVAISGGSLVANGWHRGTQSVAITAADNVGVRHLDLAVGGKPAATAGRRMRLDIRGSVLNVHRRHRR